VASFPKMLISHQLSSVEMHPSCFKGPRCLPSRLTFPSLKKKGSSSRLSNKPNPKPLMAAHRSTMAVRMVILSLHHSGTIHCFSSKLSNPSSSTLHHTKPNSSNSLRALKIMSWCSNSKRLH
jgi:hypothetical protein